MVIDLVERGAAPIIGQSIGLVRTVQSALNKLTTAIEHDPKFLARPCNAQGRFRVLLLHSPGGDGSACRTTRAV